MDEIGQLSILIGGVYDTALDPSSWVKVLEDAARFIGGSAAAVFSKDATKKSIDIFYQYGVEVDLACGAGLFKQASEMALHGRNGDAKCLCHFRHATDLNDRQENAQFSGSEPGPSFSQGT